MAAALCIQGVPFTLWEACLKHLVARWHCMEAAVSMHAGRLAAGVITVRGTWGSKEVLDQLDAFVRHCWYVDNAMLGGSNNASGSSALAYPLHMQLCNRVICCTLVK